MNDPLATENPRRLDVVCFGEPLVEFTRVAGRAKPPHFVQGFGGDTSNTAIAAARHGAAVGLLGAVGRDAFGDALLELWQSEGIDASRVIRNERAGTGIYFVDPHHEERHFTYFRKGSAASLVAPADLDSEGIASAAVLHTSAISQAISESACDAVFSALRLARSSGTLVSYDSNLRLKLWPLERAGQITHKAMESCDIAFPSLDDSKELTNLHDDASIADFYLELGARVVALKMGFQGALIATPDERRHFAALPVDVVDATGAGDVFNGVFLATYLAKSSPFEAGRHAVASAALSTTGYGAVSAIPTLEEVEAALQ